MKKAFSILLTITLLLTGCSTTAGTAYMPTQASESTRYTEKVDSTETTVSSTSEQTYATEFLEPSSVPIKWDDAPYLSVLPKPELEANWILFPEYGGSGSYYIQTYDISFEDAKAYRQDLIDAGFIHDSQYKTRSVTYRTATGDIEMETLYYTARDAANNSVSVRFDLAWDTASPDACVFNIVICPAPDDTTPSPDAQRNDAPWNADPLRALVPQPPTDYWEPYINPNVTLEGAISIELQCMSMEQVKAYAEELQAAGFVHKQEHFYSLTSYGYIGRNADGYTANIRYSADSENRVTMLLYPPNPGGYSSWEILTNSWMKYMADPVPAAEDWSYTYFNGDRTIKLYGMDYQEALAYIEQCRQAALAMDWEFKPGKIWTQDEEEQYIECQLLFILPRGSVEEVQYRWMLTYDSENEECPCTLFYDSQA